MTDNTSNHKLQLWEDGEENWEHRTDMEILDERVPVVDDDANRNDYVPYEDALFFARDEEYIRLGNGNDWSDPIELGGGNGDSNTSAEGVDTVRTRVGPLHQDTYHAPPAGDEYGIAFGVADNTTSITLHSCTLDINAASANVDTLDIEFYPVDARDNFGIQTGTLINSTTTGTLSDGPNRVDLGFTVPDGDGYSEYALFFNESSRTDANGNKLELRRIQSWSSWSDYSDGANAIDLLQGGIKDGTTGSDYSDYYYYFFDIEVGTTEERVQAPLTLNHRDVDEIYMRPRDPAEEFDEISPRALWIDTS